MKRKKSRETRALETLLLTIYIFMALVIGASVAFSQKPAYGAQSVAYNTFDIETTKGKVTAVNSGKNDLIVKFAGKAREITLEGLESVAKKAGDQFAILILMAYDAGGHYEYKKAYRIFLNECGCKDQNKKLNREYFDRAWEVRRQLRKSLPAEVIDELGLRMLKTSEIGIIPR